MPRNVRLLGALADRVGVIPALVAASLAFFVPVTLYARGLGVASTRVSQVGASS